MKLSDIKTAVRDILKQRIPEVGVVAEEVEKGFKKPAFFVDLMPIITKNGPFFVHRTVNIRIAYYSDIKTYMENAEMAERLSNLFSETLKVGEYIITIHDTDANIEENLMEFNFDISYTVAKEVIEVENDFGEEQYMTIDQDCGYTQENTELMRELELK